ncbi:MAG TPA: S-adenosylmethionine:tRNA ribosyltransferase-isomerase [Chitinophagaceae bacterium]|nr:S-adenosylmethionine:tRNA ribosyltransferase-isomerase [Chitinophagaceae bacterium]
MHDIRFMIHPKQLLIKDYTYYLPEDRIAQYPLPQRDASKLLIYDNENIKEDIYKNIANHIPPASLLIFNNTRVIEARLLFQKPTGGIIEIFCLEPYDNLDVTQSMMIKGKVRWKCMVRGVSKWKSGILEKQINIEGKVAVLFAEKIDQLGDVHVIELSWQPDFLSFAEVLHVAGLLPLPPYLHRQADENDYIRYQTVYAEKQGSVAAPTAGLHFTSEVLQLLEEKKILTKFVTLHVSAGTFKPVKSEILADHQMHSEWIEVAKETIENILTSHPSCIIPVGTTSLRTLETLYWMGLKAYYNPDITKTEIEIKQWDAYEMMDKIVTKEQALRALLSWINKRKKTRFIIPTQILIAPGYIPQIADAIITNFHQPDSTLLLLVSALIGDDWRKVYDYALQNNFRFLSYGDGSLLWIDKKKRRIN